jgi:hypothetical protein
MGRNAIPAEKIHASQPDYSLDDIKPYRSLTKVLVFVTLETLSSIPLIATSNVKPRRVGK